MANLIKADIYRIIRGKGIYICFIIITLMMSTSIYLRAAGHVGFNTDMSEETIEQYQNIQSIDDLRNLEEDTKVDISIMEQNGSLYYVMVFAVFAIACVDLSGHTIKNVLSSGMSRKTYYLSKLVLSLLVGTIFVLFNTYVSYFGNLIYNGSQYASSLKDVSVILLRQLPVIYGILAVLVMISFMTKKTSRYIGVSVALIMGVQIVLSVFVSVLNIDLSWLTQLEFETILKSLAVVGSVPTKTLVVGISTGVVQLVGATAIGLWYFKQDDIK